jgi:hypothetical protein
MSEPMSAGEIEDVLSSIRRLVSEELRPMARAPRPAPDAKLLLTPAFRVVPETEPPAAIDRGAVVGRVGEAIDTTMEFERETGDIAPQAADAPAAWDVDPEDETDVTGIESFVFQSRQTVKSAAPQEDEPEEDEADLVTEYVALDAEVFNGEVLDHHFGATESVEAWAQSDPMDAGESDDESDDGGDHGGDRSEAEDTAWANQAEAEVIAALSAQSADLGAGLAADGAKRPNEKPAEAAQMSQVLQLDGEVLRDVVRELIKEELQGGIGERITRNVRKLVRSEIARALALHDLE